MQLHTTTTTHTTQRVSKKERFYESAHKAYRLKKLLSRYKTEYTDLMDELKELADFKNYSVNDLTLTRTTRKGNINYTLIPELKGKNLEKYRGGEIESWTIVKTTKED